MFCVNSQAFAILSTMFNKTFYKFLFGFLAVLASTLIIILVIGSGQRA